MFNISRITLWYFDGDFRFENEPSKEKEMTKWSICMNVTPQFSHTVLGSLHLDVFFRGGSSSIPQISRIDP
jgi:hypothetical protein